MSSPGAASSFNPLSTLAPKRKTKKKHFVQQKVEVFRASDPVLSVLMWGVNHSVYGNFVFCLMRLMCVYAMLSVKVFINNLSIDHAQINDLSQVPIPVMLLPDDFKASTKIKVNNHLFNKYRALLCLTERCFLCTAQISVVLLTYIPACLSSIADPFSQSNAFFPPLSVAAIINGVKNRIVSTK